MKTTDDDIEKILRSLDGMDRAQPPSHFEKALYQRISFTRRWTRWFQYSAAALVILGCVNVLTAINISDLSPTSESVDYMEYNLTAAENYYPEITDLEE